MTTTFDQSGPYGQSVGASDYTESENGATGTLSANLSVPYTAVVLNPGSYGVPTPGTSTFPNKSSLVCRSVSVTPYAGGQACSVTARFSTSSGGSLEPPDSESLTYVSWSKSIELQTTPVPYVYLDRVSVGQRQQDPNGTIPAPATVYRWIPQLVEPAPVSVLSVIRISVVVDSMPSAYLYLIDEQVNMLHRINGFWYLFEGGNVSNTAEDRWQIEYTWTYDGGTLDNGGPKSIGDFGSEFVRYADPTGGDGIPYIGDPPGLGTLLGTPVQLIRAPFHVLQYVPSTADAVPLPFSNTYARPLGSIAHVPNPNYREDPTPNKNAYQYLPGWPAVLP